MRPACRPAVSWRRSIPSRPTSSSARRIPAWTPPWVTPRRAASPYGIGFIKNKYVGRTFIQGSQAQRESSVRIKLNAISSTVKGKRVVLVDDSIVRGTTSARTIRLLREAGAAEVHYRISAPPFAHPLLFRHRHPRRKKT